MLVTAGSTEVIDAVFRTFLRAGSEVVIPDPSWPVFRRRLEALEAQIVDAPLSTDEHGFHYDADRILAAIGSATRLVVVCTPNNPTGNAMELADIGRIADTGVPFLLDAAYADFDPDRDPMHLVHEYDNIVISRTFSKAYCLAGVRVGYAVGSARVLDYVDRFLVPGSSVSSPRSTRDSRRSRTRPTTSIRSRASRASARGSFRSCATSASAPTPRAETSSPSTARRRR